MRLMLTKEMFNGALSAHTLLGVAVGHERTRLWELPQKRLSCHQISLLEQPHQELRFSTGSGWLNSGQQAYGAVWTCYRSTTSVLGSLALDVSRLRTLVKRPVKIYCCISLLTWTRLLQILHKIDTLDPMPTFSRPVVTYMPVHGIICRLGLRIWWNRRCMGTGAILNPHHLWILENSWVYLHSWLLTNHIQKEFLKKNHSFVRNVKKCKCRV